MTFRKDNIPSLFISHCQQAKLSLVSSEGGSANCAVVAGKAAAIPLKVDFLTTDTKDILSAIRNQTAEFTGVHLTVIDPPEVHQYIIHTMSYFVQ